MNILLFMFRIPFKLGIFRFLLLPCHFLQLIIFLPKILVFFKNWLCGFGRLFKNHGLVEFEAWFHEVYYKFWKLLGLWVTRQAFNTELWNYILEVTVERFCGVGELGFLPLLADVHKRISRNFLLTLFWYSGLYPFKNFLEIDPSFEIIGCAVERSEGLVDRLADHVSKGKKHKFRVEEPLLHKVLMQLANRFLNWGLKLGVFCPL